MKKQNAKSPKKKTLKKVKNQALETTPEYRASVKFNRWCKAFLDPQSKTYGSAVKSALQTYNTESYATAGNIGHENYKKLKSMGMMIAENEGFNYKELMKIGMGKVLKESYDTWEKFMVRIGYFEPPQANPTLMQFNFSDLGSTINKDREARGLEPI